MWLNGDEAQGPVPFGLAIADILSGSALAQGILAALVGRGVTGRGSLIQTSLLEAMVDYQFEVLTTYLNDGRRPPKRAQFRSAHAYLAAPYGVYQTADGFIAIAMSPLRDVAQLLELNELAAYFDRPKSWFTDRDAIKKIIANRLSSQNTQYWLDILEPADVWCAKVLDWPELLRSEAFAKLDMLQTLGRADGVSIMTTRSPIRVNGKRPRSDRCAPAIGEQSRSIRAEFDL